MVINGTSGNDLLYGASLTGDVIDGGAGDDVVQGYRGSDILIGGPGNDTVEDVDGGADQLFGGYGNDYLTVIRLAYDPDVRDGYHQTPAHLQLDGGPGDDALSVAYTPLDSQPDATFGDATLLGGAGDDELSADHISAWVDGGPGDDFIEVDFASSVMFGGPGNDVLNATTRTGTVQMDAGTGDDFLYVNNTSSGANTIQAGPGNDTIYARAQGRLTIDAGTGDDMVTVSVAMGPVTVTLGPGADHLTLTDFSNDTSAPHVRVTDFKTGARGDVLDLSAILANATTFGAAGGDPVARGYVRFVQQGADTDVQVYENGPALGAAAPSWHHEVLLQGVAASSLTAQNVLYLPT